MSDDTTRYTTTTRCVADSGAPGHTEAGTCTSEARAGHIGVPVPGGYVGGAARVEQ